MEGKSFLAALTDEAAPAPRKMQYFEIISNRGLYYDGWFLSSLAYQPWAMARPKFDPFAVQWELYDLNKDFSQSHNVAAENPEQVKRLSALWWAQASKNNVLPLDWRGAERISDDQAGIPDPTAGRNSFLYPGALSGLPEGSAPALKNVSFRITAKITIDKDSANGMIFTQGGNTAGWGFYLLDGKLVATHNYLSLNEYSVSADQALSTGEYTVVMEFHYGTSKEPGGGGDIKLSIDGKQVGKGSIPRTTPFFYSANEYQDIGLDSGTGVSRRYQPPFKLEGSVQSVLVELDI